MTSHLRTLGLMLVVFVATAAASFFVFRSRSDVKDEPKPSERVAQKSLGILYLNKSIVQSNGIESEQVKAVDWQAKVFVDGRVLPNPNATLEVRAPFAGVLQADPAVPIFRLGATVRAHDKLALFEARFNQLEKLDLASKSVKAEIEYQGALAVWKKREERLQRLEKSPSGGISQRDLDLAAIELIDARTAKDSALAQWNLWKQAVESVGKKNIIVPIHAPSSGEIVEIGALPGANLEAGQLLLRIIDFRRVLVRLEFPLGGAAAPGDLEIETLGSLADPSPRWRAQLRGPAASVEVGLQKAGHLYEIVPHSQAALPNWRPGLYVKALAPDPGKSTLAAIEVPASALLIHAGHPWVYIKMDPDDKLDAEGKPIEKFRYQRRQVEVLGRAGDKLYLDARGWLPDDLVVTKRAQALLSEEVRPDIDDD